MDAVEEKARVERAGERERERRRDSFILMGQWG